MVTIWHFGKRNLYDDTVYDEKYRRKKLMEVRRYYEKEIPRRIEERALEIKKQGKFDGYLDEYRD